MVFPIVASEMRRESTDLQQRSYLYKSLKVFHYEIKAIQWRGEKTDSKRLSESVAKNKASWSRNGKTAVDKKDRANLKRYFNCGARELKVSKDLGWKCFKYGKHGHIAADYSESQS